MLLYIFSGNCSYSVSYSFKSGDINSICPLFHSVINKCLWLYFPIIKDVWSWTE